MSVVCFLILALACPVFAMEPPCEGVAHLPGPAVQAETSEAYVRLLRLLIEERHALGAEIADEIARSEAPLNPLSLGQGRLRQVEAVVFERAFGKKLARGVDWAWIREEARLLAQRGRTEVNRREQASEHTRPVLAPLMLVPHLERDAGVQEPLEGETGVDTAASSNGAIAILPRVMNSRYPHFLFCSKDGKLEARRLPDHTTLARLATAADGEAYAVCLVENDTGRRLSIIRASDGAIAGSFDAGPGKVFPPILNLRHVGPDPQIVLIERHGRRELIFATPTGDYRYNFPLEALEKTATRTLPPPGLHSHQASADRSRLYRYGFVERAGNSFLELHDETEGKTLLEVPFSPATERMNEYLPRVWLAEDSKGRPYLVARRKDEKFEVFSPAAGVHHVIDLGSWLHHPRLVTDARGHLLLMAQDSDLTTPHLRTAVLETGVPRTYDLPRGTLLKDVIVMPEEHTLAVCHRSGIAGGKLTSEASFVDLETGLETKLDLAPLRVTSLKAILPLPDGRILGLFERLEGGRALVQLYGPVPGR